MDRLCVSLLALLLFGCAESPDQDGSSSAETNGAVAAWDSAVVREVLRMEAADQQVRERMIPMMQAGAEVDTVAINALLASQDSVDRANTARLKAMIEEHGWPSKPLAGPEAASAAFIIVQHATHDLTFQKEYLAFLEEEHQGGRVAGEPVALLTDRTRQAEGKLQLYGTQISVLEGRLVLDPIEDEARVDERRAALGMVPLAQYIAEVERAYGIPE